MISTYHRPAIGIIFLAFKHLLRDTGWTLSQALQRFPYGNACLFDYLSGFSPAGSVNCLAHLIRCVQGAGTYSLDCDEVQLLGIPTS